MTDLPSVLPFITKDPSGDHALALGVEGIHCPSCVARIESALIKEDGVTTARVNLSTRRLQLKWRGEKERGNALVARLHSMGYRAVLFDPNTLETAEKKYEKFLLKCLAVSGFASGNLMLFSVPLWSTDLMEMGVSTRSFFQWVQALIAMPAVAYAGLPFYQSAWNALKSYRTNMDVPISVAVILATMMSLFETATHGAHAYFDSAVMLIFFLLIGRYLDMRARGRARNAAQDLMLSMQGSATRVREDGSHEIIAASEIRPGMRLHVAVGEKIRADSIVEHGESEIDTSLITGETLPQKILPNDKVFAGTLNLSAPITLTVTHASDQSLLADIIRLMEHAEQANAKYVTIADRIAKAYTPVVHILALGTFLGWLFYGAPWQVSLLYAATVLIITCPCALGLAVPVVQVLASGMLMRHGILLKSGSALERLGNITHIVFDKTGTLTLGKPALHNPESIEPERLQKAASLAAQSKHPLSRAVAENWKGALLPFTVTELPGFGLEAKEAGTRLRLGKRDWCGNQQSVNEPGLELWLEETQESASGTTTHHTRFTFADPLRSDAAKTIARLHSQKLTTEILSGDRMETVQVMAEKVGIQEYYAQQTPVEKCNRLKQKLEENQKILMVGDGLNDAPSLASATVSMSPSSALDITQNAADIVFQGEKLAPVWQSWKLACDAQKLVKQNFMLALLYNVIAIPMAVAGYVTPLIAAIAMSSSSLIVIANAMRLTFPKDS